MSGKLQQLNIAYVPAEDRLLLRVTAGAADNLAEFRFWLTRRMVRLLLPALDKMLVAQSGASPQVAAGNRRTIMQFQQAEALSKADFKTPYQATGDAARPLGDEPQLVTRVAAKQQPAGHHLLILQTAGNKAINLPLTAHLIHSVKKLLTDTARKAQWDLDVAAAPAGTPAATPVSPKRLN